MNLKKGVLSVVLWFFYAIIVGTGMVGTAMSLILPSGGSRLIGLVIAGVWLAVTGLVVFLLHRLFEKIGSGENKDTSQRKLIVESLLVVILFAAGIVLRVREILLYDAAGAGSNVWFETVKITETTQIPQVVHGAVYFYLQVLHGLLLFLGNKMTVALTLQAVLQIFAGIFIYFSVRKLTGIPAAMIATGYWMLCPLFYPTVVLGPETLYLLLWVMGLCMVTGALEQFQQNGEKPGIRPVIGFFGSGVILGVLGYLDFTGFLLLFLLFSVVALETVEAVGFLRRIGAGTLGLIGTAVGFFLCIALDALGSGKQMENVLMAWWKVYAPKAFSWPVTYGQGNNAQIAVVALLGIGVFGYWCRKKLERQSTWLGITICLAVLICYGMTTADMKGLSLLYLLVAILTGAGIQSVLPYTPLEAVSEAEALPAAGKPDENTGRASKRKLKIQDLETEEFPEPDPEADTEAEQDTALQKPATVQLIENPLPVPKKHVPKVLNYKLTDEAGDFDYPVAEDDDFDH